MPLGLERAEPQAHKLVWQSLFIFLFCVVSIVRRTRVPNERYTRLVPKMNPVHNKLYPWLPNKRTRGYDH